MNAEPDKRPTIHQVVDKLKAIILENYQMNDIESSNLDKVNSKKIESTTLTSEQIINILDLSIAVNELVTFIFKITNEGKDPELRKKHVLKYLNNHDVNSINF